MHTDPRILTGQKGASTLTHWYDNDVTGDHHSFSSCHEINSVSDTAVFTLSWSAMLSVYFSIRDSFNAGVIACDSNYLCFIYNQIYLKQTQAGKKQMHKIKQKHFYIVSK